MKVLWNDSLLKSFSPSQGVIQGDSLYSYIFVLCIEHLACMIQHRVEQGAWEGIQLNQHDPKLSHHFFTDDLLLFIEADLSLVQIIKSILGGFWDNSGEKVNASKIKIFFSRNVETNLRGLITGSLTLPLQLIWVGILDLLLFIIVYLRIPISILWRKLITWVEG